MRALGGAAAGAAGAAKTALLLLAIWSRTRRPAPFRGEHGLAVQMRCSDIVQLPCSTSINDLSRNIHDSTPIDRGTVVNQLPRGSTTSRPSVRRLYVNSLEPFVLLHFRLQTRRTRLVWTIDFQKTAFAIRRRRDDAIGRAAHPFTLLLISDFSDFTESTRRVAVRPFNSRSYRI